MSKIKLKTSSPWIRESHFTATEFFGKEVLGFNYSEKEFVENSIYFLLFDTDFDTVPYKCVEIGETNFDKHSHTRAKEFTESNNITPNHPTQPFKQRNYFCPDEFYILCNKGIKGYESSFSVLHCVTEHSETTEDGTVYNVSVSEAESKRSEALIHKVKEDGYETINQFFTEHLTLNLCRFRIPIDRLIQHVKETVFLDNFNNSDYKRVEVIPHNNGDFYIADNSFKPVVERIKHIFKTSITNIAYGVSDCSAVPIDEGDYVFTTPMPGVKEIFQVEYFAHSVYAKFFAVVKPVYVYPRDKKAIEEMFPDFYMEHCIDELGKKKNEITKDAKTVPYIPENSKIGDGVIYRLLNFSSRRRSIADDGTFHVLACENGFFGSFENGVDSRIGVEIDKLNATLIQVDDKFKILFYKFITVVSYKGDYYAKFNYSFETDFFEDFTHFMLDNNLKHSAYNGVIYQLFMENITPVVMDMEQYKRFGRPENLSYA